MLRSLVSILLGLLIEGALATGAGPVTGAKVCPAAITGAAPSITNPSEGTNAIGFFIVSLSFHALKGECVLELCCTLLLEG